MSEGSSPCVPRCGDARGPNEQGVVGLLGAQMGLERSSLSHAGPLLWTWPRLCPPLPGPTSDEEVNALRMRQMKNFHLALMLSQVPALPPTYCKSLH